MPRCMHANRGCKKFNIRLISLFVCMSTVAQREQLREGQAADKEELETLLRKKRDKCTSKTNFNAAGWVMVNRDVDRWFWEQR